MSLRFIIVPALLTALIAPTVRADELPTKTKEERDFKNKVEAAVDKGLKWVADTQFRDGHWEATGGQPYPTSMTSLCAMTMLMEGSNLREGKYADNLRRAVDWLMDRAQPNGLIGNPRDQMEQQRYMYGHGFSQLFLASVYGEEEDSDRRKRLEKILTAAVKFTGEAQTDKGGWGYLSAKDGSNFDEGSVTITQLQALRAARNAGIVVPKSVIDKATKYLKDSTTPRGGVIYSLHYGGAAMGGERTPLTAAAVACAFSSGEYDSDLAKKWLEFCATNVPVGRGRVMHDEYLHYYLAQAVYILGENGWQKLFPKSAPGTGLVWSKYRQSMFEHIVNSQARDGSWSGGYIGPQLTTAVYLTILQLDKAMLPIYQR